MSFSQVLEVAIGLVLIYYVLGSIVSWFTKIILEMEETRGKVLEDYLHKIAGDKTVDLTLLPQMKALQPIRYKSPLSVFSSTTVAKKIEKVPVNTLVDAFFDLTGLTGRPNVDASELRRIVASFPESEGKQAMLTWIDQGVTSINTLRTRVNAYFTGLLDQASAKYKAHARSFVISFSIVLTLILGTDSIQLAKDLWINAELRALTAGQAEILVQQGQEILDIDTIVEQLKTLSIIKLGWWQLEGALPEDASILDWAGFVVLKLLGLGLTAVAVSQGSSFWYDLLKKLTASPAPSKPSTPSSSGDGEPEAVG
jgi:hypothetical protein